MAHSTFSHRLQFWPYYFENVLGHLVNSIAGKHLIFVKNRRFNLSVNLL